MTALREGRRLRIGGVPARAAYIGDVQVWEDPRPYQDTVLAAEPVALWPCDDLTRNIVRELVAGNHGIVTVIPPMIARPTATTIAAWVGSREVGQPSLLPSGEGMSTFFDARVLVPFAPRFELGSGMAGWEFWVQSDGQPVATIFDTRQSAANAPLRLHIGAPRNLSLGIGGQALTHASSGTSSPNVLLNPDFAWANGQPQHHIITTDIAGTAGAPAARYLWYIDGLPFAAIPYTTGSEDFTEGWITLFADALTNVRASTRVQNFALFDRTIPPTEAFAHHRAAGGTINTRQLVANTDFENDTLGDPPEGWGTAFGSGVTLGQQELAVTDDWVETGTRSLRFTAPSIAGNQTTAYWALGAINAETWVITTIAAALEQPDAAVPVTPNEQLYAEAVLFAHPANTGRRVSLSWWWFNSAGTQILVSPTSTLAMTVGTSGAAATGEMLQGRIRLLGVTNVPLNAAYCVPTLQLYCEAPVGSGYATQRGLADYSIDRVSFWAASPES